MEFLILLFLILLNGVFAMSEMAVVSARKARLQQWADERRSGAQAALALANEPSIFLSTIQVGITVIGITSGAFGEAALANDLSAWLSQWPVLDPHSESLSTAIVVAGITIASLIIGELVPKRIALLNSEAIASLIAKPMRLLSLVAYPLVRALSLATEGILAMFGAQRSSSPPVTEEEIIVLMEQGRQAGVFQRHEQEIVSRAFRLDQLRVSSMMTVRADIVYLRMNDPDEDNIRTIVEHGHSIFPVVRDGLDDVKGVIHARDLLRRALAGEPFALQPDLAKPLYVPVSVTATGLLELFKKHRQTAALVVGEHGDIRGMVTLNDVMQALVGDIAAVELEEDQDIVRRSETSWLLDGSVPLERLEAELGIDGLLPGSDDGSFYTLGGFIMHNLGRVPSVADRFDWHGWRFEVVDMDGRRIDKVLLTRLASPTHTV